MENEHSTARQEVILAAAIMKAEQDPNGLPKIEDISLLLFKLRKAGIDLGQIALRRVPGGFYSDDIEELVGHYLAAGYAEQRSPVKLTEQGRRVLTEIISQERKDNPQALGQLEAVLGNC